MIENQASSQGSNRNLNQAREEIRTKNMFIHHSSEKDKATYYIPAYLRVKMKNITELSHQSLQGSANMILILDINTKDLDEEIVEYLKRNLIMRFNRDDAIILDPKKNYDVNMKILSTNHLIRFTIRKILKAYLKAKGKTRKTPQETIQLILSVSLPGIIIEKEDFDQFMKEHEGNQKIQRNPVRYRNLETITLKFNFMDLRPKTNDPDLKKKEFLKFSFSHEIHFGEYYFHHDERDIDFSKESVSKKFSQIQAVPDPQREDNQYKQFCHAHYKIPLRRDPIVATFTLIIPLIVLAIFNTGIFLQGEYLPERFGNWITLMIAFVAFIPVIRDRLPPNPNMTFMEILLLLHILVTTLGFFYGFHEKISGVKDSDAEVILLAISAIPIIGDIFFFIYLLVISCYQQDSSGSTQQPLEDFNHEHWSNSDCNTYFTNNKGDKRIFNHGKWKQEYQQWWERVRCSKKMFEKKFLGRLKMIKINQLHIQIIGNCYSS